MSRAGNRREEMNTCFKGVKVVRGVCVYRVSRVTFPDVSPSLKASAPV